MNAKFLTDFLTNINTPDGKLDYRKIAFPAVSVLVSAIVFFIVVIPQIIQIINNQNELLELQTQSSNLESKIAALNSISTTEFESNMSVATSALPATKDYIDSTPYIQDAINKSSVKLTGLSFAESNVPGPISSYLIKVDLEGSLTQMNQFLTYINRSARVIKVSKIELSGTSAQNSYTATMTLLAFYAPNQKQNIALTQPVVSLNEQELAQIDQLEKTLKSQTVSTPNMQVGRSDPFN
jgi:Tfp pilus assembly protein PilO